MFSKDFQEKFWKRIPHEAVKDEGVIVAKSVIPDSIRMRSDGSGFVQVINGCIVANFDKDKIVLVDEI